MSDHIKSKDLCERCAATRFCRSHTESIFPCDGCKMRFCDNIPGCRCLTIPQNTPCPYFEEAKDDG